MKTEIPTPLTDNAERQWHEHHAEYAVRDLCRKLERMALSQSEGHLVKHLLELYNASWEAGNCRRDCRCAKCEAMEEAGNHNVATFDSLTEKASAAMSNAPHEPRGAIEKGT